VIARLDRRITSELIALTLVCALALTFLFTALGLYQVVNRFEVTPNFGTLLSFTPSLLVSLLPLTLPISGLFSAALVYGRMRAERELLALAASGVPPWRPFMAALPLGLLCALGAWLGVSELGPQAYAERHDLQRKALADFLDEPPPGPRELRFPAAGRNAPSMDISYAAVDAGRYDGLTILIYDDAGLRAVLRARTADIRYLRHSGAIVLSRCFEPEFIQFDPETGAPAGAPFKADRVNELRVPFRFGGDEGFDAPKALATAALVQRIEQDLLAGRKGGGAAAELTRRFGLAAAGLLLPLLGALLAAMVNHPNRLLAVGAGVVPCAVGYYPMMTAATTLADKGTLGVAAASALAPAATTIAILIAAHRHNRGAGV
jgi:lipopolysaccharide export LptBFGC system permease protein LptF